MLFSVIVPVYNVADYLPKCMESLLRQKCQSWEIILVDDGSTDGKSGALCDEYAAKYPELVRVIHQPNGGLGAARNTGMEDAKGEYLFFIDSDDWIADNTLSRLTEEIGKTHADMYVFSFRYVSDSGEKPAESRPSGSASDVRTLQSTPDMLLDPPGAWIRICKRGLFLDTGIRFPGRVWYEDLCTTPKLFLEAKSIVQLDDAFYFYYLRQGSIMRNSNLRRNLEILNALETVRSYYAEKGVLETYKPQLTVLAVDDCCAAAQRVLMADPKAEFLPEFLDYVRKNYPSYRKEPMLNRLGKKKLILLRLLEGKHYKLARTLFRAANKLK
jgi:glycosyltransferase involved in cell wall biosynthesis